MITQFKQNYDSNNPIEIETTETDLRSSLKKTREALEAAYSGFDNALDSELIDSYIFEINALKIRYQYITELICESERNMPDSSRQHSSIRALISHVFG